MELAIDHKHQYKKVKLKRQKCFHFKKSGVHILLPITHHLPVMLMRESQFIQIHFILHFITIHPKNAIIINLTDILSAKLALSWIAVVVIFSPAINVEGSIVGPAVGSMLGSLVGLALEGANDGDKEGPMVGPTVGLALVVAPHSNGAISSGDS